MGNITINQAKIIIQSMTSLNREVDEQVKKLQEQINTLQQEIDTLKNDEEYKERLSIKQNMEQLLKK